MNGDKYHECHEYPEDDNSHLMVKAGRLDYQLQGNMNGPEVFPPCIIIIILSQSSSPCHNHHHIVFIIITITLSFMIYDYNHHHFHQHQLGLIFKIQYRSIFNPKYWPIVCHWCRWPCLRSCTPRWGTSRPSTGVHLLGGKNEKLHLVGEFCQISIK